MFLTASFTRWLLALVVVVTATVAGAVVVGATIVFVPWLALPVLLACTVAFAASIGLAGRLLF